MNPMEAMKKIETLLSCVSPLGRRTSPMEAMPPKETLLSCVSPLGRRTRRNILLCYFLGAVCLLLGADPFVGELGNDAFYPPVEQVLSLTRGTQETDTSYKTQVSFLNHEGTQVVTWGPSGHYNALLPIDRYFGTEAEIKKMIERGIMEKNAKLYIPCFDCDSSPQENTAGDDAPERDLVYLNGHYLGTLQGVNETVTLNTFEIPLEYLNFPKYPGSQAVNRLMILVDTANDHQVWYLGQLWQMLVIEAPPPVLLVHGWTNQQDTLAEFSQNLSHILGIPSTLAEVSADHSPHANAVQLQADLARLTAQWGVDQFNIVAHSKGGLDTRVLIDENGLHSDYVYKALQVATPNRGSLFADAALAPVGVKQKAYAWVAATFENGTEASPSFTSLTVENCIRFNEIYNTPVCPLHTITGQVATKDLSASYRTLAKFVELPGPNDGMVTVESAHALNTAISASPLSETGSSKFDHSGIVRKGSPEVIEAFQEFLQEKPDTQYEFPPYRDTSFATRGENAPDASFNATQETQAVVLTSGKIHEREFALLSGGNTTIGLFPCPPNTCGEILLPDGKTTIAMTAEALPEFIAGEANILTAELPDAQPGKYRLRIDCTTTTKDALAKILVKEEKVSFAVEMWTEETIPPSPTPLVTARCTYQGEPIAGPGLTFTLRGTKADDTTSTPLEFTMRDDGQNGDTEAGDGIFSCQFLPTEYGYWDLETEVMGEYAGNPFSRYATARIPISNATASILTPLTETTEFPIGAITLPCFTFAAETSVHQPGRYGLTAELTTPTGTVISTASTQWISHKPESHSCLLTFPTDRIVVLHEDGPWTLQNLRLSLMGDCDTPAPPITLAISDFTQETDWTKYSQIAKYDFAIRLLGTGTEAVLANTPNLFHVLEVRLDTDVVGTPPPHLDIQARVMPTTGTTGGFAEGELVPTERGYQAVIRLGADAIQSLEERNSFVIQDCTGKFFDEDGFPHEVKLPGVYTTQEYQCSPFQYPTESKLIHPEDGLQIHLEETPDDEGFYKLRIQYPLPEKELLEGEDSSSIQDDMETYFVCIPADPMDFIQLEGCVYMNFHTIRGKYLNVTDKIQKTDNALTVTVRIKKSEACFEEYDIPNLFALQIFQYPTREFPAECHTILHPFDTNADLTISQNELDAGRTEWTKDNASPQTLLEALELSQGCTYLYDNTTGQFHPVIH